MALSSSNLFSHQIEYQIDNNGYNTIINAVALGGVQSLSLLPSLNLHLLRSAYYNIINQPEMTLQFIAQQSNFRFFFYKTNDHVWEIVTNNDATHIFLARLFNQANLY